MPVAIEHRRCTRHPLREAVARCPECARFFCRECISEYADRVLCADCIAKLMRRQTRGSSRFAALLHLTLALGGVLTAWLFFDALGRVLVRAPSSFHQGTVWDSLLSPK
jgi:hypothetical protein